MSRSVISAADVQKTPNGGVLTVASDAIITPLARDLARERGIDIVKGSAAPAAGREAGLADQVRSIVERLLARSGGGAPSVASGTKGTHTAINDATLEPFPFPGPPPGMDVRAVDVVTSDDGSPIAAGYMSLTKGEFPWTLTYDEVQIVLEGELHLGGDAGGKIGRPGDVLYVPKGSSITFGTPSWTKFVYVTFPADWSS